MSQHMSSYLMSTMPSRPETTTPPSTPFLPCYWHPSKQRHQSVMNGLEPHEETPKISNNSKRRFSDSVASSSMGTVSPSLHGSTHSSASDSIDRTESTSSLDCQSLQRSLKRVRLSSSPGELRLKLDLRHLVISNDWEQPSEDVWFWPRTGCRLEQSSSDPMRLVLHIPLENDVTRVWIHIPRMYPHRPPTVSRIQHAMDSPLAHISSVSITMDTPMPSTNAGQNTTPSAVHQSSPFSQSSQSVLIFPQWTCILRLADVLEFLQASLGGTLDNVWATAPPMPDARGFLAPGRFDMGFYKGNKNAMDLKE